MSVQRNFVRSSASLGVAMAIFIGGYSANTYATPAVFFNDDTAAGKTRLISTITTADPTAVIVDFNVLNSSTDASGVTAITTTSAGTVYVKTTRGGTVARNSSNYTTDGFTSWSVPGGASWSALVSAGYTLEFFSDAALTTPFLMNAIGLRVADWGTCCTGSNRLPDGTTAAGSALYIQFGSSQELLIGSISSSRSGRETFIGAIDDRNSFSSVTLIPNGTGEAFLAGGEFVFSQVPVPVGSVAAGSSSVVGASNPSASGSSGSSGIPDIDTAVGAYTTSQLTGGNVNPNFTGGTLTVATAGSYTNNFTVQSQGGTVNDNGLAATFSGVYSGVGAMTFAGSNVTTLTGVNTYTGGTTTNSGATLALTGSGSIATSSLLTNNGTFDISGTTSGTSVRSLAGSGAVALGSKTLTISNGSSTFSGAIGGTGGLTVSGGTQTLSGTNTLTGASTVNTGATLALSGSGSIATSSLLTNNGTFNISGTTSGASITSLAGSGAVTLGSNTLTISNGSSTFSGAIGGTGGLTVSGGTQTLSGTNTFTGASTVNTGATLALTGDGSIDTSSLLTNNGTFNISGTTSGASITSLAGSGAVTLGSNTLTISNGSSTFSGAIGGTGGLTVVGGTQTLSGTNTFTGATSVDTGATLALTGSGSVVDSSYVTGSGSLDISGTTSGATVKNISGSLAINLGDKTLSISNGDANSFYYFNGVISGTGGVTLSGGSNQSIYTAQTYTGATVIDSGSSLLLGVDGGIAGSIASSSLLTNNGLFDIGGLTDTSITSLAGSGSVVLGEATLTITNSSSTFSGVITGTGGLALSGGTQTLTGANDYSGGTTVSGGTLIGTTTSLQGAIVNNATTKFDQTTNGSYSGAMSGTGTLVKSGSGTVTLTGANTYSGGTTVSAGTLQGTTTSLQGAITNNATTEFNQSTTGRYSGNMTGTGSLIKSGSGVVTLSGTSTLGGTTVISGGTLDVAGTLTATSGVNCAGTAATSLRGAGRVNGSVVVGAGCTLAPGASPGTITLGSSAKMLAGSTLSIEIDGKTYSAAGGAGSYDRVVLATSGTSYTVDGTLSPILRGISGAANNNFTPLIGDRFRVISGGDILGEFTQVLQPVAGMTDNGRFDVLYGDKWLDLIMTPKSFAVLGNSDGWTQNAISAATSYDSIRPEAGVRNADSLSLFNLLYQTERSKLGPAFHQLSGQIYVDATQSARLTTENALEQMLNTAADDFTNLKSGLYTVWVDATNRNARTENDGTALGYRDDMKGFSSGIAFGIADGSHIGVGASYGSSVLLGALGSRADIDVTSFHVFGGGPIEDQWSYAWSGGISLYDTSMTRELTLANATTRAMGEGGGRGTHLGAYLRYSDPLGESERARVNVKAGLQSFWFTSDALSEKVLAADGGLMIAGDHWEQQQAVINAELVMGTGRVRALIFGEAQYDLSDAARFDLRRVANGLGGSWIVRAPSFSRTQTAYGLGVHMDLGEDAGLRLDLANSSRGDGFDGNSALLRIFLNR